MKTRFYISEISEDDIFKKIRKNFESIINAAFLTGDYNNKGAAFQLLGGKYEVVKKHLVKTVTKYSFNQRYKLIRRFTSCQTVDELVNSYNYRNLKLVIENKTNTALIKGNK